jgi:hypothetical protein
MLEVFF